MRVVITDPTEKGKVLLNHMWLPAFLAFDAAMKVDIEKQLGPKLVNRALTEETLDWAHEQVLDLICHRHQAIVGLRDYLDSMKFVVGTK